MVGRGWFVLGLFVVLLCGVFFEQRFIDESCNLMKTNVLELQTSIENAQEEKSKNLCKNLQEFWGEKEKVLSLFVDFKDIEKIGSQLTLVSAHLENKDFELALVENRALFHALEIFYDTVCFDWQNII